MKKTPLVLIFIIFTLAISAEGIQINAGEYKIEESKTFHNAKDITVKNENGNITAEYWDSNYVKVEVFKSSETKEDLDKFSWSSEEKGGKLILKTTYKETNKIISDISMKYTIMLPKGSTVEHAETENGNININYSVKDVKAVTENGCIVIKGAQSSAEAETDNGTVTVEAESVKFAKSSNGNIRVKINKLSSDANISTSNGIVKVFIKETPNANVTMKTSIGDVEVNDFKPEYTKNKDTKKVFKLGNSKYKLNIETSIGIVLLGQIEEK